MGAQGAPQTSKLDLWKREAKGESGRRERGGKRQVTGGEGEGIEVREEGRGKGKGEVAP